MKIACIGCGGIGSYFAEHVDRLIDLKQITNTDFIFFDDDTVEKKNILYQNFEPGDIGSKKTGALEFRYLNLGFKDQRVSLKDLLVFDLVILCADNNIIRRDAYQAFVNWHIPFIDARANGKTIGIFSNDTPDYLKTIDDSTESQSCQNPFQIEREEIEFGNVVIAAVLAQNLLTYTRTKQLPNDFMVHF